jgi:hypothetical protein
MVSGGGGGGDVTIDMYSTVTTVALGNAMNEDTLLKNHIFLHIFG